MACVLVVDDDVSILETVKAALEDEGHHVLTAVDGEAIDLARTAHPDVILLDVMMPRMDGVEVSQRLRAHPDTAIIPIIAMSAQSWLNATREVLPVDARLPKPFNLVHLYQTVAQWAS